MKKNNLIIVIVVLIIQIISVNVFAVSYEIVGTGQTEFYDNNEKINEPSKDEDFYGQDAMYIRNKASYTDNEDGTITDNITGLMWQKDAGNKKTYEEAIKESKSLKLGGYSDWRMANIKELYSLINFNGITGKNKTNSVSYLDDDYFEIYFGDKNKGERYIDAQYMSSTKYVSTTMKGAETVFGVNFVDGRIKGYGLVDKKTKQDKEFYTIFVRGNEMYGKNKFIDNKDGTITDLATGLMWLQEDSKISMSWKAALEYGENMIFAGYDDWKVPDAKELQSIVDYSKSPATSKSAAINSIFNVTRIKDEADNENYPFYWTSTTHLDGPKLGSSAVYIAFGEALGYMQFPRSKDVELMDVHGAGAQRSDPKVGNASDYPNGFGPQGDVRRINNYVRLVRRIDTNDDSLNINDKNNDAGNIEQENIIEKKLPKRGFGVILIGTGGPTYSENRSSPSTLIYNNEDYFLVDMGEGTQKRLIELKLSTGLIETLMFTHHHIDHDEEYPGILVTGWMKGRNKLNLIGPKNTKKLHDFVSNFYEQDMEYRANKKSNWSWNGIKTNVFIKEVFGTNEFIINDINIKTIDVEHTIDTQAYRFEYKDKSIVISGDLRYSDNLIELSQNADILVIDSGSVIKKDSTYNIVKRSDRNRAHGSLEDIANMAQKAGVKKLVLTHIGGDIDKEREIEEISKIYSGDIVIGEDLMNIGL